MKQFLLILALCAPCFGQSWVNVLSSKRAVAWTNAGLQSTFADGETTPNPWTPPTRTKCGSTLSPSGDSTGATDITNITNALSACTSGTYTLMASGEWYLNNY